MNANYYCAENHTLNCLNFQATKEARERATTAHHLDCLQDIRIRIRADRLHNTHARMIFRPPHISLIVVYFCRKECQEQSQPVIAVNDPAKHNQSSIDATHHFMEPVDMAVTRPD